MNFVNRFSFTIATLARGVQLFRKKGGEIQLKLGDKVLKIPSAFAAEIKGERTGVKTLVMDDVTSNHKNGLVIFTCLNRLRGLRQLKANPCFFRHVDTWTRRNYVRHSD